jgi:hypothetical protein
MQNKSKKIIKLVIIMFMLFSIGATAYAVSDYTVLTPLPGTTDKCVATNNTNNCTTNLQTYLPGLFKFAIGLAAVMAFVMITFGGITYMTTDAINAKSAGREYIENALWGLLLVLGAWIILNTINPKILSFQLETPTPNIPGRTGTFIPGGATGAIGTKGSDGLYLGYTMDTAMQAANASIVKTLVTASNGLVSINHDPCTTGGTQNCTNVYGLPKSAQEDLINLTRNCNCGVVISGGTEGGHEDHAPGLGVVDISNNPPNTTLNTYLAKTNPAATKPQNNTKVTIPGLGVFTYETTGANGRATGDHWHVMLFSNTTVNF